MTALQPSPEEWHQFQQESQQHEQELTELMSQASALVQDGHAEEACALYRMAQDKADAFYNKWETWVHLYAADTPFESQWHQQMAQTKASLLWGMGGALHWVGRLEEAHSTFEQALSLLGEQPDYFKASLLQELGGVCQQQGSFSEAESYYLQAHSEFVLMAESFSQQPDSEDMTLRLWTEAARTLSLAAHNSLSQGNRPGFLSYIDNAIRFAETHDLHNIVRELWFKKNRYRLDTDPTGETLQKVSAELAQLKSLSQDPDFQVDALCLIAGYWRERGALDTAKLKLQKAIKKVKDIPNKKWLVLQELASVCESQERIAEAVQHSEEALRIAWEMDMPELIQATLQTLIPLRLLTNDVSQREQAEQEINELRAHGTSHDLVMVLLLCASVYCKELQFDRALKDIEEAEQCAPTYELRFHALLAKIGTLRSMKRQEEALKVTIDAITPLKEQMLLHGAASITEWKSLLSSVETLHENAAFLAAELGQAREAFEWAESGKAIRLHGHLAWAGLGDGAGVGQIPKVTFDDMRDFLAPELSAMAVFCVTGHGTLVLILDPQKQEPQCFFLDFTEVELKNLLPTDQVGEQWNDVLYNALPTLSEKISPSLFEIVKHCSTLYLVPDSKLYSVPFAALVFENGSLLIEHCALAYTPSATVLKWCRSRRTSEAEPTCLTVGVGHVECEQRRIISFAEQARNIMMGQSWADLECLLDEDALVERFLDEAPHFNVLHISCHGLMEATSPGALSASFLQFTNRNLSAKDVYDLDGRLHAELVFLNACLSGRFQSQLDSEVGGFWEAFLHAGATSLIVTLSYVHPEFAQQLALDFYREWLGGATKVEALRSAQLRMQQQHVEPRYWASHILIGNHQ